MLLHRFILDAPPGTLVDHVNGRTLDNRRANLRAATPPQNSQNRRARRGTRAPYKGVRLTRTLRGFVARIQVDGRLLHLGVYETARAAAQAYDTAAREFFGPFARTNFPAAHCDASACDAPAAAYERRGNEAGPP